MTRAEKFVDAALSYNGCPYIWRGKGRFVTDKVTGQLVQSPFVHVTPYVFDCSGLVTHCLWEVGFDDLRATEYTLSLFKKTPSCRREDFASLWFFGQDDNSISHVAIHIGNNILVQASGGTSATNSLEAARQNNAMVRTRYNHRESDYRGARMLGL